MLVEIPEKVFRALAELVHDRKRGKTIECDDCGSECFDDVLTPLLEALEPYVLERCMSARHADVIAYCARRKCVPEFDPILQGQKNRCRERYE